MAVLCIPRRIRSSDRGKGDCLKCGIRPAFCSQTGGTDRSSISPSCTKVAHDACVTFNVNNVCV